VIGLDGKAGMKAEPAGKIRERREQEEKGENKEPSITTPKYQHPNRSVGSRQEDGVWHL